MGVVVGGEEDGIVAGQLQRVFLSLVIVVTVLDKVDVEPPQRLDLGPRRGLRYDDGGRNTQPGRGVRDAQSVVARRGGDDPGSGARVGRDGGERSPYLE